MDTAVVIIVATIGVASIAFLAFGLIQPQRGPKATEKVDGSRHRWAAQATLAEMRKEGAGLPSEVGEEANRSEGRPGAEPPQTPTSGSPPAG
jgi:hypothetical protein